MWLSLTRRVEIGVHHSIRESTGTEKETEARRFLREGEGRAATGQPILPRADRVRYEEAAADVRRHYEATGSRDLSEYDYRVKHLDHFFAGHRIVSLGQPAVNETSGIAAAKRPQTQPSGAS